MLRQSIIVYYRHMPPRLNLNTFKLFSSYAIKSQHERPNFNFDSIERVGRLDSIQHENEHLHKLLSSNKMYVNTIAFLDYLRTEDENCTDVSQVLSEHFKEKPTYTLLCYLKLILKSCQKDTSLISNPKIVDLCEALIDNISDLRDEHLWNLLKILTLWPNRAENQQFFNICKAVDQEALQRSRIWGYDSILLTMDHFFRLRTLRYSEFAYSCMKRLWRNPSKLSPQQVVHAMFLVNTNRRWHPAVDMLDVEAVLMFYMYDLSVEEVAILASAFFKTQTYVKNIGLVEMIYNKLEPRIDDVEEITLSSYLKFFRLCDEQVLEHRMIRILDKLTNRIHSSSIFTCTHIALLGSVALVFHPQSLQKVCERFYNDMKSARLKDLERLAFVLELYNFTPENEADIFERISESLHTRQSEILEYHHVFLNTVYYLALRGYYDHELVTKALSISFLRKALGNINKYTIPQNVVHLSIGVKLECPDYKGSYLDENFIADVSQKFCRIPRSDKKNLHVSWEHVFSIRNILCRIFGSEKFVHTTYLLPYAARADICFCLKDNKPVEIPADFLKKEFVSVRPPPDLDGTWYTLVLLSKWNIIRATNQPIGSMLSKLKHLEILGYRPILVNQYEYEKADKPKYIKGLIESLTR